MLYKIVNFKLDRRYFLQNDIDPLSVEKLIQKNLLPIRAECSNPRKVKRKSVVSFLYRVS